MSRSFQDLLNYHWSHERFVCVGLDPVLESVPSHYYEKDIASTFLRFNRAVVDMTAGAVCAYKINPFFYQACYDSDFDVIKKTVSHIISFTDALIIFDAKYGDVSHTNSVSANFTFNLLGVDAVTVNPYCGFNSLDPFFQYPSKGVFVFCRSSDITSEIQDLMVNGEPLYRLAARYFLDGAYEGGAQCAFIVGANHLDALEEVRFIVSDAPVLVPGIGAQGGTVPSVISAAGIDNSGKGLIISASRSVIFADNVRGEIEKLNGMIH